MNATYRLQLTPEFTFADAERLVPDPGRAGEMVDVVVARGRAARVGDA